MAFATGLIWFVLLGAVIVGVLLLVLQVFLSRAENRWLGMVLPVLSFLFSLVFVVQASDGGAAVRSFVVCNISTVLYLLIYFLTRRKKRRNDPMDQMKIRDL